jgi:tetratricopeptide (TPR) repeat protein
VIGASSYDRAMPTDRYGLEFSTESAAAADAYRRAMDAMLGAKPGAAAALRDAIDADPGFALAHAALSRLTAIHGNPPEAVALAERAVDLAGDATPREQEATMIHQLQISGKPAEALHRIRAHISEYPLDAMVLNPASGVFGIIGFSGRSGREREQLDLLTPLADSYGDDPWFLATLAFALVETGQWTAGREMVEQSLDREPDSAHAVHVLAHALYEAGDDDTATEYLDGWLPDYEPDGMLHCHLWWHLCLLLIAAGESERAWTSYDRELAPDVSISSPLNVFTDGASLQWRALLAGETVSSDRWQALADFAATKFPSPMVFYDAHGALPHIGLGQTADAEAFIAEVEASAAAGKLPAGDVAAAMSRAFVAFSEDRWAVVIDGLGPMLDQIVRIGGSRAQRDLAANTVLAAYARSGRWAEAESLLADGLGGINNRQPTRPVGVR